MDKLNHYRQLVREVIEKYAAERPSVGDIQIEKIFDESNDHYELMYAGWNRSYRIHGSVLHIDIRDGKIWIQYDGTPDGIAYEFLRAGVPREDIVPAFKPPEMREMALRQA